MNLLRQRVPWAPFAPTFAIYHPFLTATKFSFAAVTAPVGGWLAIGATNYAVGTPWSGLFTLVRG